MKLRVQIEQQTYEVEVGDLTERPIRAVVDGIPFEVLPEEALPLAAVPDKALPVVTSDENKLPAQASNRSSTVTAPIPGVILSITVKAGDAVSYGQELCILEAMKMKNQIRANRAGIIRTVNISPGEQVNHNQVLFEFSD